MISDCCKAEVDEEYLGLGDTAHRCLKCGRGCIPENDPNDYLVDPQHAQRTRDAEALAALSAWCLADVNNRRVLIDTSNGLGFEVTLEPRTGEFYGTGPTLADAILAAIEAAKGGKEK